MALAIDVASKRHHVSRDFGHRWNAHGPQRKSLCRSPISWDPFILQLTPCDLVAVVGEAERLSELHTFAGGHRSIDILHVAAARVLKATTLLTFDLNQRKLASAVRLSVGP